MTVDHVSICKFTSKLGPFTTVSVALWELLNEVTNGGARQPKIQEERRVSTHNEPYQAVQS